MMYKGVFLNQKPTFKAHAKNFLCDVFKAARCALEVILKRFLVGLQVAVSLRPLIQYSSVPIQE